METKENYTKEELDKQKDYVISEFNFHEVMDFCETLNQEEPLRILQYNSIAEIREELRSVLDGFIRDCLEDEIHSTYYNNKWFVCFSRNHDGTTPYLEVSFQWLVSGTDAAGYKEFSK